MKIVEKVINQLQRLSLDSASGLTALVSLLEQKEIINHDEYLQLKQTIRENLVKELDK